MRNLREIWRHLASSFSKCFAKDVKFHFFIFSAEMFRSTKFQPVSNWIFWIILSDTRIRIQKSSKMSFGIQTWLQFAAKFWPFCRPTQNIYVDSVVRTFASVFVVWMGLIWKVIKCPTSFSELFLFCVVRLVETSLSIQGVKNVT